MFIKQWFFFLTLICINLTSDRAIVIEISVPPCKNFIHATELSLGTRILVKKKSPSRSFCHEHLTLNRRYSVSNIIFAVNISTEVARKVR